MLKNEIFNHYKYGILGLLCMDGLRKLALTYREIMQIMQVKAS